MAAFAGSAAAQTITTFADEGVDDVAPATRAQLNLPFGVADDAGRTAFLTEAGNRRVRKVAAGTGMITTVAGTGTFGFSGDGEAATSAQLNNPFGVAVDANGNLFIADLNNQRIRKVAAGTGMITTVAGTGVAGFSGDGGAATGAPLNRPFGVAVDAGGNLLIADTENHRIRMVAAGTGMITTVAGTGMRGFGGDGGAATRAQLSFPSGVVLDVSGNLFITDGNNNRIRKVAAGTGIITTVAWTGTAGFSGDGGAAMSAQLNNPFGVALDASGNLYMADTENHRLRRVAFPSPTRTPRLLRPPRPRRPRRRGRSTRGRPSRAARSRARCRSPSWMRPRNGRSCPS